jgi:hypothetical protein
MKKKLIQAPKRGTPTKTKITVMLYQAGSSPSEVARLGKVSSASVTKICKGESKSARIQGIIESILNKPWDKLIAEKSS